MKKRRICTSRAKTDDLKRLHAESCALLVPRAPIAESNYRRTELLSAATRYGQGTMTPTYPAREARLLAHLHENLIGAALAFADALKSEQDALRDAPSPPEASA